MKKKLTLSLEEDVIKKAKIYANEESSSVSSLVENYLKAITSPITSGNEASKVADSNIKYKTENTPLVKKMRGMLDSSKITGNERYDYLMEKYK